MQEIDTDVSVFKIEKHILIVSYLLAIFGIVSYIH